MANCKLCNREKELTFHHLIPKSQHKRKRVKRMFNRDEMKTRGLDLCGDCHPTIHQYITEKDMSLTYNTKEALLSHPKVAKFVEWVAKQNKKAKRK